MSQAPHRGSYPADWPAIAERIKTAAAWRCARCGHAHDVATHHVLTVHHFDGDKSNCHPANLMPLCQRCHLSVQSRVDPAEPLMFRPSTWAAPYVVAYYASGRGTPPPGYAPEEWAADYISETGQLWPWWARLDRPRSAFQKQMDLECYLFGGQIWTNT